VTEKTDHELWAVRKLKHDPGVPVASLDQAYRNAMWMNLCLWRDRDSCYAGDHCLAWYIPTPWVGSAEDHAYLLADAERHEPRWSTVTDETLAHLAQGEFMPTEHETGEQGPAPAQPLARDAVIELVVALSERLDTEVCRASDESGPNHVTILIEHAHLPAPEPGYAQLWCDPCAGVGWTWHGEQSLTGPDGQQLGPDAGVDEVVDAVVRAAAAEESPEVTQ
jgi:hypothetical protein